jgi:4-amino-4-deoxy-L-arabinose transferase-like glycosyltransferase
MMKICWQTPGFYVKGCNVKINKLSPNTGCIHNPRELMQWERIVFISLLVLFCGMGVFDHSLWAPNESREGAMIAEMYRTGNWVIPTLNGSPYLEKPPLLHWTGLALCTIAGRVDEGMVRLPAAIFGFGAIFLAYLFARRLGYERAGMAGAFMCATSILYLEYSRVVLTDVCIAFMVMLSLWLFWSAYTSKKWILWLAFISASALSFYAKGLLGPGFIWFTVICYLLYRKEWKLALVLPILFIPVFILLVAPWAWALYKKGGTDFLHTVFWANQFGRFLTLGDKNLPQDPYFVHKEPIYFYLVDIPVRILPWTLPVIAGLINWFRKDRGLGDPLSIFLRFSIVCMSLVLLASSAKATRYALPMFPIFFLMAGVWLQQVAEGTSSTLDRLVIGLTGGFTALILLFVPVTFIILNFIPPDFLDHFFGGVNSLTIHNPSFARVSLLLCMLLLLLEVFMAFKLWRLYRQSKRAQSMLSFPALCAGILIPIIFILMPVYDYQRTLKPFAEMVKGEVQDSRQIAIAFDEPRYLSIFTFYLGRSFPILNSPHEVARFLATPGTPSAVIAKTEDSKKFLDQISPGKVTVLKSTHKGYNVDSFRLLINTQ